MRPSRRFGPLQTLFGPLQTQLHTYPAAVGGVPEGGGGGLGVPGAVVTLKLKTRGTNITLRIVV